MKLLLKPNVIIAATLLSTQISAASDDPAFDRAIAAVQQRMDPIDQIDGVIPGRVIVAVKSGSPAIVDALGMTRLEGGEHVDGDTPFYIASMTKAFVGLMAVRLDADGTMPLDSTLADHFPDMVVEGVNLQDITMRRLLSHQLGFRAPILNIRTAYTDRVPVNDYSKVVNNSAELIDEAFRYDNLGYLLYAGALEKHTGRSWKSWIEDSVFDPLDMQHSSARTSDFNEVSHLHMRFAEGLRQFVPKSDAVMHAAGGIVVSGNDMAKWLSANVGGDSQIPQAQFAIAQSSQVKLDMREGPMHCTGYTFGWRQCEAMGLEFYEHGGGYTGMRGQMVIMPDKGVGFAVMFNSDSMTGGLSGQLMQVFLMSYAGMDEKLPPTNAFAAQYAEQVAGLDEDRTNYFAGLRAKDEYQGWTWKPEVTELWDYTGSYDHAAFGTLRIALVGNKLVGRLNDVEITLDSAAKDVLGATMANDSELEPMTFERGAGGAVSAVTYGDRQFIKR